MSLFSTQQRTIETQQQQIIQAKGLEGQTWITLDKINDIIEEQNNDKSSP